VVTFYSIWLRYNIKGVKVEVQIISEDVTGARMLMQQLRRGINMGISL
jgi:hypothetical protein